MMVRLPSVFHYLEYRRFLADHFEARKREDAGFSHRAFSNLCGMATPNFLLLLIQGKRNLGPDSIPKVAAALGLSRREERYFQAMVEFDQAGAVEGKAAAFDLMARLREPYAISALDKDQLAHYRNWYNPAIRELLAFYPFHPSRRYAYRRLASLLSPAITESEARGAVRQMLKLGLLKRLESGRVVQAERFISTGDEAGSLLVRAHHLSMADLGRESLDRFPPEDRDVSGLTVSISDQGFVVLKQELKLFRKRLLERVKEDQDPKHVFHLNLQLFPLTHARRVRKALAKEDAGQ